MFYYLVGIAIFLTFVHILFNYNAKARAIFKLPSRKGNFIIGNALDIMVTPVELFRLGRELAAEFSGIYGFHAFPVSCVNIYNPEDIETITSSMKHHEKGVTYTFFKSWLRNGLLLSNGAKWQKRRKLLTPAFHFNVLKKYYATMKDNDKEFIKALKESKGEPVEITSYLSEHTLNIICETAMGTKLRENSREGKSYKNAIYSLGKLFVERFSNVYLHPDFTFNLTAKGKDQKKHLSTVHNFTASIIEERKKAISANEVSDLNDNEDNFSNKQKRGAMLDLLISSQKEGLIDDVGIQEEVDTFSFEGHDTTASGLTYILLLLANYPDVQNKLVQEIKEIFGNDTREATIDDLAAMKYLDLCIKESLRLYPPVPFIMRQITQPCKLSNFDIPANTLCCIYIYDVHRDEKYFKDAHMFIPERFLPENSVGRHNYAYIPFSAGPRNCIGQKFAMLEMKSTITSILRDFELKPVTTERDLCFMADLVLRNTNPIYVKFVERKQY